MSRLGLKTRGQVSGPIDRQPSNYNDELWVRPADWIALPSVVAGDEKIVFSYAIFNSETNFLAFSVAGAYTVDWGDGSPTENIATGVVAQHNYAWASVSSGTLTSDGYRQVVVTITPQAGNNITAVNFQRKYTGEAASGFLQTRPFLDMIVAAPLCTSFVLGPDPNVTTSGTDLTLVADLGHLQRFVWVGDSIIASGYYMFAYATNLRVVVPPKMSLATTTQGMFYYCMSLVVAPEMDISSSTAMWDMFYRNHSLRKVPLYKTSNVTDMDSAFYFCVSLEEIPLFDTSSVTYFGSTFQGCSSLKKIPPLNTSSGVTFTSMFNGCSTLETVPMMDLVGAGSLTSMFNGCTKLKEVPLFDTSTVTSMSSMFNTCRALKKVPAFNTANVTAMDSMFNTCYNINEVPLFNTANVTTMASMFASCFSLRKVPLFNTANVTDVSSMFSSAYMVNEIPAFDFGKVTTAASAFGTSDIRKASFTNMGVSFSLSGANISSTQLDAVYTNLITLPTAKTITAATWTGTNPYTYTYTTSVAHGFRVGQLVTITGATPTVWNRTNASITAVTSTTFTLATTTTLPTAWTSGGTTAISATVTVTNAFGAAADTPTIATAKGWTVTG